ncbi:hypothetical protein MNL01_06140 [Bartonella krasnovii]|uniref:hypothetical protein n=1 Tax=Bartonella krasnovii TaxID=2267275 RepID=UPI001F4CF09F|nr:hypothetical protein [Bartonella krasnovii]UNF53239.1 hypothetical protein MNL01_06140 [Bartonella krasnovii]
MGAYRGCGANGFMMDVQGTLILGNKKDLTPEQRQTLTSGETFSFTAPKAQSPEKKQQKTLLPEEKRAALKGDEITESHTRAKTTHPFKQREKKKPIFHHGLSPMLYRRTLKLSPKICRKKNKGHSQWLTLLPL